MSRRLARILFFFKQKTAYEIHRWLECRRVLFRSFIEARTTFESGSGFDEPGFMVFVNDKMVHRSEERRVGKEWRSGGSADRIKRIKEASRWHDESLRRGLGVDRAFTC